MIEACGPSPEAAPAVAGDAQHGERRGREFRGEPGKLLAVALTDEVERQRVQPRVVPDHQDVAVLLAETAQSLEHGGGAAWIELLGKLDLGRSPADLAKDELQRLPRANGRGAEHEVGPQLLPLHDAADERRRLD